MKYEKEINQVESTVLSKFSQIRVSCLTSSISWRDTFLPSLLEAETEPESVTGASAVWLFGWSFLDSREAWVEDCISCELCE